MTTEAPTGTRRQRRLAALMAAGLIVLALLTVFAIELSDTQAKSRRDVTARLHERSVLAAALINSLLKSTAQQLPLLEKTYGTPVVSTRTLNEARQQNDYLVLLDRSGAVLASSAGFTAQAQADLKKSAALRLVRAGHPYGLGNLLPYGRTGVVNFAVAIPTRYGVRYLLTGLSTHFLGAFLAGELRRIPGVRDSHNYVIDGNDVVLASTNPARPAGYRFLSPEAIDALSQASGDRRGHYYDESAVDNSTWRIVLTAPDAALFASVSGWRVWLPWLIFAAFALVAAAALGLGLRVVRSAEIDLRHANTRLEGLNRQLEEANQALAHAAMHDSLTGLPNRTLFMDRLDQALQRAQRDSSLRCAVLFIDLDGFKPINDRLTHAVGDQVLAAVAHRFQQAVRPADTVARIGGDEFAVLLDRVRSDDEAKLVADRVSGSLSHPIQIADETVSLSASIGLGMGALPITGPELLRQADMAMYEAKRRTGGPATPLGPMLTLS